MSDAKKFGGQDIVPLKPVDVKDRFGLAAAVYAINALYIRSGKESVGMLEVRTRIAALIKHADVEKLAILLQEWYLETIDIPSAKKLLNKLPAMIEIEDKRRYLHNPFVNDIEWSALATIYDCCIAVKFLAKRRPQLSTSEQNPGWKIAVPTPKFFGRTPSPASDAGLRPWSLISEGNPKNVSDSRSSLFSRFGASGHYAQPKVQFEGYIADDSTNTKPAKRVVFSPVVKEIQPGESSSNPLTYSKQNNSDHKPRKADVKSAKRGTIKFSGRKKCCSKKVPSSETGADPLLPSWKGIFLDPNELLASRALQDHITARACKEERETEKDGAHGPLAQTIFGPAEDVVNEAKAEVQKVTLETSSKLPKLPTEEDAVVADIEKTGETELPPKISPLEVAENEDKATRLSESRAMASEQAIEKKIDKFLENTLTSSSVANNSQDDSCRRKDNKDSASGIPVTGLHGEEKVGQLDASTTGEGEDQTPTVPEESDRKLNHSSEENTEQGPQKKSAFLIETNGDEQLGIYSSKIGEMESDLRIAEPEALTTGISAERKTPAFSERIGNESADVKVSETRDRNFGSPDPDQFGEPCQSAHSKISEITANVKEVSSTSETIEPEWSVSTPRREKNAASDRNEALLMSADGMEEQHVSLDGSELQALVSRKESIDVIQEHSLGLARVADQVSKHIRTEDPRLKEPISISESNNSLLGKSKPANFVSGLCNSGDNEAISASSFENEYFDQNADCASTPSSTKSVARDVTVQDPELDMAGSVEETVKDAPRSCCCAGPARLQESSKDGTPNRAAEAQGMTEMVNGEAYQNRSEESVDCTVADVPPTSDDDTPDTPEMVHGGACQDRSEESVDCTRIDAPSTSDDDTSDMAEVENVDAVKRLDIAERDMVADPIYAETTSLRASHFIPRTRSGRLDLDFGELSDATILFQRVYNGEKRTPTGMHGKALERIE